MKTLFHIHTTTAERAAATRELACDLSGATLCGGRRIERISGGMDAVDTIALVARCVL